ncbi:IS3 family transposase [Salmonella enterica]|uniref:IS3 family transposase n=1 Tax=Enterobacteriaceae TaxID=543 RepID=UPI003C6EB783
MKRSKFTETQIVNILKLAEKGVKVTDICREHGISSATYYQWKSKYGGLEASDLKRLREIEAENAKLKKMYAELALENAAIKDLLGKPVTPERRREATQHLVYQGLLSIAKACRLTGLSRRSWYRPDPKQNRLKRDQPIVDALNTIIQDSTRSRWGFWKCFHRLRLDGNLWNFKRVWRIYCAMNLNQKRRTKKRLPERNPAPLAVPAKANYSWSFDFMSDALYSGTRFRVLNIIDEGTREALDIVVDTSLPATRVVRVLEQLKEERGVPRMIRVDNGSEMTSSAFTKWCENNHVRICYIEPGKPNQNAYIERFNRSYRTEVLNPHLFSSLAQVRELSWAWMLSYNEERPHESLGNLPPSEFKKQLTEKVSSYELCA